MAQPGLFYTLGVAVFAAIGTFLFGFDTGIATTTIAHDSWVVYMHKPSKGLTGAVVAIYIAGEACGALFQTAVGDQVGRIRFMQLMVGPFRRRVTLPLSWAVPLVLNGWSVPQ